MPNYSHAVPALLVAVGAAVAFGTADPVEAEAATTFRDGFERTQLTTKLRRSGPARIQSRFSARGRRALLIPRTSRRALVTRRFPTSRRVHVALSVRRARNGMQRLVTFPRSGVSLYHDGRRLKVRARGRNRVIRGRFTARGTFTRVAVILDARTNRLSVYADGKRRAVIRTRLRAERKVRLGGLRNRSGPTWIDDVRIVAGTRPGSRPPAGGSNPGTPPSGGNTPGGGDGTPGSPGGGTGGGTPPGSGDGDVVPVAGSTRFFADDSVWNKVVSGPVAIDPNSGALVADLARQARLPGLPPTINSDRYSTAVYTVDGSTPEIDIRLDRDFSDPLVLEHFKGVPLPAEATPSNGTDSHIVVHRPSTDQLWEFWTLNGTGTNRGAGWGGRLDNVSTSSGIMEHPAGATATGLPLVGGLITLAELRAGRIDHALAMAVPQPRAEWFTPPANRTDGFVYSDTAVPEGAHFRLDPSVDIASLNLPRPTRILAEAAQRHGLIVRDKAGVVAMYAEDPGPSGSEAVYDAFYGGMSPQAVLEAFPWDNLQLLKMDLECCWNING